MSNTLLLAIDGSPGSSRALDYITEREELSNLKVVVCYVIEWSPYSFNTPEENAERHARREQEISKAESMVVNPFVEQLKSNNVQYEAVVRHGKPVKTLIALAKDYNAIKIVIGRTGQSGAESLLFGSVVGKLAQTSPIPVVVVP